MLDANAWGGGNELDLVVRRGRELVFVEVKSKTGTRYGTPAEMVGPEKQRRVLRAAEAWLASHPDCRRLEVRVEVVALQGVRLLRLPLHW